MNEVRCIFLFKRPFIPMPLPPPPLKLHHLLFRWLLQFQFIQPPGHAPDVIHIALPKMTFQYTHSFVYFLRQYLLQRFHTPRFTEANPEFHFKNYGDKNSCLGFSESLPINDVYLYNRRETKGRCKNMAFYLILF